MLNLPVEIIAESLSYITDVTDILNLSTVNSEMNNILKSSITTLTTKKDLIILKDKWIDNYPLLSNVSDDIVFKITDSFKIPYQLKKFNIYVDAADFINIFNLIINNLHHHINQYTIRLISDFTIIIDQNMYQIYGENNVDEILYIESVLNNLGLNKYDDKMMITLMYPSNTFRQFINDLDLDICLSEFLPGYEKYRYISIGYNRNLLFEILKDYTSNDLFGMDDKFIYAYVDPLLEKYVSHFSLEYQSDKIIAIPYNGLKFDTCNEQSIINYAHFYLCTNPSIYTLCLQDWYKF